MTVKEIASILEAKFLCCEEEGDRQVGSAFASDMMSDVLAFVTEDTLLLTGRSCADDRHAGAFYAADHVRGVRQALQRGRARR